MQVTQKLKTKQQCISESGKDAQREVQKQETYLYKIKQYEPNGISQALSFMLIRPPRFLYNQNLLVPSYKLKGKCTYDVYNIPFPLSVYSVENMEYVVLYLHGNSSSRFEGYMHLSSLPDKVGLACFDFGGCGLRNQQQFITLGKKECKEVDIAARFLKEKGHKVVGWGRSMGSVSLLMSQEIDIMIADSPFSSLNKLCKESSSGFLPSYCCCIFHCFYPCVYWWVRSQVHKRSGMDPAELQIIQIVRNISPDKAILFMAGENDGMIRPYHSQRLYQVFRGKNKKIVTFDGTHNSSRPKSVLKQCYMFIQEHLGVHLDNLEDYSSHKNIIITKAIRPLPKLQPLKKIPFQKSNHTEIELVQENTLTNLYNGQTKIQSFTTKKDLDNTDNCLETTQKKPLKIQAREPFIREAKTERQLPRLQRHQDPSEAQYYTVQQEDKQHKRHSITSQHIP